MKVKIIADQAWKDLEKKANKFMSEVKVVKVEVTENYDIEADQGYTAYHIFYEEEPRFQGL